MVLDHPDIGHMFAETQIDLAMTIGGQAAVAIENARLHQELRDHADQLERRVQERTYQLHAQYAWLDAILRGSSDGIIVTDVQGEVVEANPVAEAWLDQTLAPEDTARLREAVRDLAVRADERPEAVLELTGLDLELIASPIMEPRGKKSAIVVAVHDVSHLKALDRVKSRFVSDVSHELRTPITTIKLYAALMKKASPEKMGQYLEMLAQEADRQAQLVEGILQISRIDAGRLEMSPRPTSLNELGGQVVANHLALARERGLKLEYRLADPDPVALADPDRMMQVLDNMVMNAINYTPTGGKVVVSTGRGEMDGRTWATAAVMDTGIGIPADEVPQLFVRFFRGEQSRMMQVPGTGLGLAIVKEIVELHGGKVAVETQVGKGSTFTVWLPLA
jgi:two-component system sensor histidine kinase VicK